MSGDIVSWQSAFWALVPIALNSIAQPCGKVQGYPSRYAYLWKISPIVCMFDAAYLTIELFSAIIRKGSLRRAAQQIRDKRFSDSVPESERNSMDRLQENVAFRIGAFFFGVIPQTIKLYSMRGIPWTQVWGSMFFGSFLVIETILLFLKRLPPSVASEIVADKKECLVGVVTVNTSFTLSAWALVKSISWQAHGISKTGGTITLAIGAICAVSVHLGHVMLSRRRPEQTLLLASSFIAFATVIILWQQLPTVLRPIQVLAGMVYTLVIHTLIWAILPTISGIGRPSSETLVDEACQSQLGFGIYFMLLHAVAATCFYAFNYNTSGTYKPPWSNQLG